VSTRPASWRFASLNVPGSTERTAISWGMVFLVAYTMVAVGRIQEVITPLAMVRIGFVFGLLALVVWFNMPGSLSEKIPLDLKPIRYVLILLGLSVVTIPFASWPGNSFTFVTGTYIKIVLLFLLIFWLCRSVKDIRRIVWGSGLALAVLVVSGLMSGNIGRPTGLGTAEYVSKTYDPNDMALVLVTMIPLLLYLFATSRGVLKVVLVGLTLVNMYGIVQTQSRGGFLALLVVGGLVLYRSTLSRQQKLIIATLAVIVFGILAGTAYWDRIRTIWDPQTEYDRTGGGRTEVWKTGLMLMAMHPWGVGIDGFVTAEGLSHGGSGKWSAPHNTFLQIGAELGVAGLIVFVLMLKWVFGELRAVQKGAVQQSSRLVPRRVEGGFPPRAPVRRHGSPNPDEQNNLVPLAAALQTSLVGFVVGGFFLSQAYGALFYAILGLSLVTARLAGRLPSPAEDLKQRSQQPHALRFATRFGRQHEHSVRHQ
jgi:O-antigen ligase